MDFIGFLRLKLEGVFLDRQSVCAFAIKFDQPNFPHDTVNRREFAALQSMSGKIAACSGEALWVWWQM